jgi:hypothetical protein
MKKEFAWIAAPYCMAGQIKSSATTFAAIIITTSSTAAVITWYVMLIISFAGTGGYWKN